MSSRPRQPKPPKETTARDVVLEHERACDTPTGYEEWARHHALHLLQRTRPQLAFLTLTNQTGLFWGGVRTGKSTILAHDCGLFLLGEHPQQTHRPPTVQLHAGRSWSQMVEQLRTLWGVLDPRQFRAKLDLSEGSLRGQRLPILSAISGPGQGSQIRMSTYKMGPLSVQGWTIHRAQLDEPPDQPYYTEVRSRVITTRGRVRMGFCPTQQHIGERGDKLDYVWDLVDEGEIGLVHAPLCLDSVTPGEGRIRIPYMSQGDIDAFTREIPARDRLMRLGLARYPMTTGRYFDAWSSELIEDKGVPGGWSLGIGIDHGSKPGRQRASLVMVRGTGSRGQIHVLAHYQGDGRTDEDQDARGILEMIRSTGHELADIDYWIGDRAHGGDRKGGIKSNQRLLAALARAIGIDTDGKMRDWRRLLPRPLQRIWTPEKYGASHWDDMEILHRFMVRRTFTIDPTCTPLHEDFSEWNALSTDPHKDGIDSVRYVAIPMLAEGWRRPA